MEITVYIDVLWLRTFFTELLVCMFVNLWMKQERPVWRLIGFTAFAVSAETALFVTAGYGRVYGLGSLSLRVLLLFLLFRPGSGGVFLRLFLWSVAANAAMGGILSVCQRWIPRDYWFGAGLCICASAVMGCILLEERRRRQDAQLYRILLLYNGRSAEVTAFYDTGNRLIDPYVHAPVSILAESVAQALIPAGEPCRLVPFSTVGAADTLMRVWTIDAMEWQGGRRECAVIGAASDTLFEKKEYQMILAAAFRG